LIGGIDLAGEVIASTANEVKIGDLVLVNGCGLSETRDGGYTEVARVHKDAIIHIPNNMNPHQAMQIGTAGYTAALAINNMEHNGQTPKAGPILVTGATGGVGSVAINMLASKGYEVVALTSKTDKLDYLKNIGATEVLMRDDLDHGKRPLEKAVWGGAIDNLGGETLTWLTRTVKYGGNIACIGLAASHKLETTVIPLILRAINLLGINSVDTPRILRKRVWERIGDDLFPKDIGLIAPKIINFDDLPNAFDAYIDGNVSGRVVVKIQ
jgi:NADPH2:quinone reductase